MGNLLRRGQYAGCIHKPGRVRVMHYHYWIERGGLGGQEKIRDEIS